MDEDYCQAGDAILFLCTFFGREIENRQHTENAGVVCNNKICHKQKPDMQETSSFFFHKSFCGIAMHDLFFQHAPIDVEATFCLWVNVVGGCDHTSVGYGEELEIIVKKSNYLSTCKGNLQDLCMQTLFLYMSQLPLNEAAWIVLN